MKTAFQPKFRNYVLGNTIFRLNVFSVALLSCFACSAANAAEFAEFDVGFLRGNSAKNSVDISRFSYGNPTPAGEYVSDVYLNQEFKGRLNLRFVEVPAKNNTALCADDTLLEMLDLTDDAVISGDNSNGCLLFDEITPDINAEFDLNDLQLNVNAPQAFIKQRPRGYISPAQWQIGAPVAFVRYDASHYRYKYADIDAQQSYLGINAGINFAGWSLRHQGSLSWQNQQRLPYQSAATYLQRDIAALRAQIKLGDFNTDGVLMDSFGLRGIQLSSDDRMLATSVQGYAPIIRGIANSNARVTVRQNGNILREINVPAGPFSIDDLYPMGYGGDLQVEILEANGEKRTFNVPYTAAAQLIRPGYSRYQIAAGRYRYGNILFDEKVAQATWQYGLSNNVTLNFGSTFSKNYHAELLGLAFNTPIGTFATSATLSSAKLTALNQKYKGYSLSASYNTRIEPTHTNVTLAAYRYLSRDYLSLPDVMLLNHQQTFNLYSNGVIRRNLKNQFQISISQAFKPGWGSAYLIGTTNTYWDNSAKQNQYQFGYSNNYKRLSYNLAFSQTRSSLGSKENIVSLNFSLPIGNSENAASISQQLNYNPTEGNSSYTTISGTLGEERRYSYNLSFNKQPHSHNYAINQSYYGSLMRLGGSWSQDNQHNRQFAFNVSGAVVAHPKGITLANDLTDTFAIIHAKGAKGALINGTNGSQIDRFGNGIVPYISPYKINYVGIDTDNLPDNVEFSATEEKVIPRANNAILIEFATTVGNVVFFEIQNHDKLPPLGTEVFDQNGQAIGVVAQGGRIYSRGIAEKGELHLSWGDNRCEIAYQINQRSDDDQPIIVPVQCQFK